MNFLTLFEAYKLAEQYKSLAVRVRSQPFGNGEFGIAVGNDEQALKWQRYDRLSRRIDARFYGIKVCPNCVCPNGNHYPECRHYEQIINI